MLHSALCTKCKWAKDAYHIDPVSNKIIGRFTWYMDAAYLMIRYHCYPPPVQRGTIMIVYILLCIALEQPASQYAMRVIPQLIVFGRKPANLPNGVRPREK